jgi:histidine triad (HIT) family protein
MELTPEQQQAIEQQKAQCLFCQIIEEKIPSKKIYEDKLIIGILDINPAAKGHVLVMPKEHYPIMPIIPPETFKHLFDKTKQIDKEIKNALLCKETTMFIANGGAAGQQSNHFMLHIIPRENDDHLEMLDIQEKEAPADEIKDVVKKTGEPLKTTLMRNLTLLGYTKNSSSNSGEFTQKITKQKLLEIINSNQQLKQLIVERPDQFKQIIPQNQQLKQLFRNFNADDIIKEVREGSKPTKKEKLNVEEALKKA